MSGASDFAQILHYPQTCEFFHFYQDLSEIERSSSVLVDWYNVIEHVLRGSDCEQLKLGCELVVTHLSIHLTRQQFRIGEGIELCVVKCR